MIERNCSGAWELSEIITASNNRLYAYRTCLGWCAAEPVAINKIKETKLPCSRVLVQGFGSQDVSKYFFEFKTKVKEDDIKGMLEPIYLAEFPEKYSGSGDEK